MVILESITCCVLAVVTFAVFRKELQRAKDVFLAFWLPRKKKLPARNASQRKECDKENLAPKSAEKAIKPVQEVTDGAITKEFASFTEKSTKVTEEKEGLRIKSATLLPDDQQFNNFTSQKLNEQPADVAKTSQLVEPFPSFSELRDSVVVKTPADVSTSSKTEEVSGDDRNFVKTTLETKHEVKGGTETSFMRKEQESVSKTFNDVHGMPDITLDTIDLNNLISATQKKLDSFKNGFKSDSVMPDFSSNLSELKKTEMSTISSTTSSQVKSFESSTALHETSLTEPRVSPQLAPLVNFNQSEPEKKIPPPTLPKPKNRLDPTIEAFNDCLKEMERDLNLAAGDLGFSNQSSESSSVTTETPFGTTIITKKKKMFSSSSFYEEPHSIYPTVEEQVEMARKIADSLADDTNKKSKGANMFYKRVKRSSKWIHEGPEPSDESGPGTPEVQGMEPPTPDPSLVPFRPSKGPPRLKLVLDPRHPLDAIALRSSGLQISEHNVVSPEVCHGLVKDLHSPVGKGAALFAKRKKKSEEWVVDEEKVKALLREQERKTSALINPSPFNQYATMNRPEVKLIKSPWEAAMESPFGLCDAAFARINPEHLADTVIKAADNKLRESSLSRESSRMEGCISPPAPVTPAAAMYDIYHAKAPRGWAGNPASNTNYSANYSAPVSAPLPPIPNSAPRDTQKHQNAYQPMKKMVFQNFNTVPRLWKGASVK